jgi:hypothetical protein
MPVLNEHLKLMYEIENVVWLRKHRVMYLYPAPTELGVDRIRNLVSNGLDKKLSTFVQKQLKAYMVEGQEPPAEIAATIYNFADDLAHGRDLVVRTGDYIALQGYMQRGAAK